MRSYKGSRQKQLKKYFVNKLQGEVSGEANSYFVGGWFPAKKIIRKPRKTQRDKNMIIKH